MRKILKIVKWVLLNAFLLFIIGVVLSVSYLRWWSKHEGYYLEEYVGKTIAYVYENTTKKNPVCTFHLDEITDFEWDYVIYSTRGDQPPEAIIEELGIDTDYFDRKFFYTGLYFIKDQQIVYMVGGWHDHEFKWGHDLLEAEYYIISREDAVFEGRFKRFPFWRTVVGECYFSLHSRTSLDRINLLCRGMSAEEVVHLIGKADGEQLSTISLPSKGNPVEWVYTLRGSWMLHLEFTYSEDHGSFLDAAWFGSERGNMIMSFFSSEDAMGTKISWPMDKHGRPEYVPRY